MVSAVLMLGEVELERGDVGLEACDVLEQPAPVRVRLT